MIPSAQSPSLLRSAADRPHRVAPPTDGLLADALPVVDWSHAVAVRCAPTAPREPQVWADAIFGRPPLWVGAAMLLREALVGVVGIERAHGNAFTPLATTDTEVLLGIDQSHLDFRASVRRTDDGVVLTTVVHLHNRRGRIYSVLVHAIHPSVVRASLGRAARSLQAAESLAQSRSQA